MLNFLSVADKPINFCIFWAIDEDYITKINKLVTEVQNGVRFAPVSPVLSNILAHWKRLRQIITNYAGAPWPRPHRQLATVSSHEVKTQKSITIKLPKYDSLWHQHRTKIVGDQAAPWSPMWEFTTFHQAPYSRLGKVANLPRPTPWCLRRLDSTSAA